MKIPGRGRFNKWVNIRSATKCRSSFNTLLPTIEGKQLSNPRVDLQLVSFSSKATFSDQAVSILSFLKHVGVPLKWIILSDGSYDKTESDWFEKFGFIEFVGEPSRQLSKSDHVLCNSWQEKKFYSYASLRITTTTIFLDSDILFLPGFSGKVLNAICKNNWYLPDMSPHFDPYFLEKKSEYYHQLNYTNSGFFILNHELNWDAGRSYFFELREQKIALTHFSEQTAMELVFKDNGLSFLDPRLFSLTVKDHFTLGSSVDHNCLAIRHFMGPIRFRIWQTASAYNYFL